MMQRVSMLLAALGAVLLTAGCPLLDLEVRAARMCVAIDDVGFDGVPASEATSVERTVDIAEQLAEINQVLDDLGVETGAVRLVSAAVSLVPSETGPQSFGFVHQLDIVARSPGSGDALAPLMLVQCADCGLDSATIELAVEREDMVRYIESGSVELDVAIAGQLPRERWGMSLELCFDASGRYQKSF